MGREAGLKSKVEYALLAAVDLAVNYAPKKPVKVRDIAARTGAPPKYVGQLLLRLKMRALVQSAQGPTGGYWLMRRPALISVAEVLDAVGSDADGRQRRALPDSGYADAIGWLCGRMEEGRRKLLSGITLADLAKRAANGH